ncbi:hypothetical protein CDD82_5310 [Ophiocordyceps australis]|uniref:Inosine/uridine-preferring nucleoside hydrolase domain-containing protein n=1 Tax=Ophiocordyceps australis TaxID=1399860 RepID=A0A2C5XIK3_9HYPO|nr:hypothetical protein CDD82_5310 [Ophiocordyceps australis]
MAPCKVIIDTDPGVDDIMAMLLALSASSDELEVAMLSITYGNVPLKCCLRNAVALFHVLEKELAWRRTSGRPEGYACLKMKKPIVAMGPEHPLEEEELMADYFHGEDGLHNVHRAHPHLSPADTWHSLFDANGDLAGETTPPSLFTPSSRPSHLEMLRILAENPVDTVSILALGPLTNVALAAAEDPETFLRAKELVVMGGAIDVEGNVTPVAEFNGYADSVAAARVYALTSPTPSSTMPPLSPHLSSSSAYPSKLWRPLRLVLAPLDVTTPHLITRDYFAQRVQPLVDAGSPLAQWTAHFINGTFNKIEEMLGDGNEPGLSLHDPLTVWYVLTKEDPGWKFPAKPEDIRVETSGQWTRGMHVVDRRTRAKPAEAAAAASVDPHEDANIVSLDQVPGDTMGWLSVLKGNRIHRIIATPGQDVFKQVWMDRVFCPS